MPKWLVFAIVTFAIWGTWGFVNELAFKAGVPPLANAVLFTIGLLPAAAVAALSPGVKVGADKRRGLLWGFATGVAGGLGNIAYYRAAELGKAAVVYPLTSIYPLVTLGVAWLFMRERLNRVQAGGVALAVAAVFVASATPETWSDPAAFATALGTTWMGFTLIAVVFWGLTGITQKLATNHVSAELSLLGFVTGFFPLTAFVLLFTDTPFTFGAARLGLRHPRRLADGLRHAHEPGRVPQRRQGVGRDGADGAQPRAHRDADDLGAARVAGVVRARRRRDRDPGGARAVVRTDATARLPSRACGGCASRCRHRGGGRCDRFSSRRPANGLRNVRGAALQRYRVDKNVGSLEGLPGLSVAGCRFSPRGKSAQGRGHVRHDLQTRLMRLISIDCARLSAGSRR